MFRNNFKGSHHQTILSWVQERRNISVFVCLPRPLPQHSRAHSKGVWKCCWWRQQREEIPLFPPHKEFLCFCKCYPTVRQFLSLGGRWGKHEVNLTFIWRLKLKIGFISLWQYKYAHLYFTSKLHARSKMGNMPWWSGTYQVPYNRNSFLPFPSVQSHNKDFQTHLDWKVARLPLESKIAL